MNKKYEVHLEAEGKIKDSVEAWLRSYLSLRYIKSAVYFAKQAKVMEKQREKSPSEEVIDRHTSYIIASIFATVAFLEATINEILRDSYDMAKRKVSGEEAYISSETLTKLSKFNEIYKKKKYCLSLLKKYQISLDLAETEKFNESDEIYKNVQNFITLRNKLVHYEPTWAKVESPDEYIPIGDLEKYLYGKFELNPLAGKGNPFLFDKCLGYSCCKWGIESSLAFTDEFCRRTGIKAKYTSIKSKLVLDC